MNTHEAVVQSRIVAIIRLEQYDRAVEIARALLAGGISVLEFTLTGAGAHQAISATRTALGDAIHVGVGSVTEPTAAKAAISAGAQFVVTPVLRPLVIEACQALGTPILCGALTPTELLTAHEAGADMVKLFPARLGGRPTFVMCLPHYRNCVWCRQAALVRKMPALISTQAPSQSVWAATLCPHRQLLRAIGRALPTQHANV